MCLAYPPRIMESKELQRAIGRIREAKGITKYRVVKDGIMSGITQLNAFESGQQTAQLTTVERYLNYLGYKLDIIEK